MTTLTRAEQIIAEKTVCILLLQGTDPENQQVYAYIAVRADRLEAFMAVQTHSSFAPEEYGMIVESGIGEPSEETRARMHKEYGFNHEQMVFLNNQESQ